VRQAEEAEYKRRKEADERRDRERRAKEEAEKKAKAEAAAKLAAMTEDDFKDDPEGLSNWCRPGRRALQRQEGARES